MTADADRQPKPTEKSGKVLVLGDDDRAFLAVVRSLGRAGLRVHVAWAAPNAVALKSKYIAQVHALPRYAADDLAWKQALEELLRRETFDLVVPCNDRTLLPLHVERESLSALARLAIPNEAAFDVAFDKGKANELAGRLGLPLARERVVASVAECDRLIEDFGLPLVVKPQSSFTMDDLRRRHRVRKVYDRASLERALGELLPHGEVRVQENFVGAGAGVELLADGGEVLLAFQHLRLHEPLTGGGSSYRKSVPLAPGLLDAARRLMDALSYTGVAMVEFKVEQASGRWIFIEINGRFWGSLPLALAAGADFPYALYQMLVEGRRSFDATYRSGIFCRNLMRDLTWLRHNLRADRSDPTLQSVPLPRVAAELGNLVTLRERFDTLVADDPRPGVTEIGQLLRRIPAQAARRGRTRLLAAGPLRERARRRARQALQDADQVLFVCKGNICRSPFAEAWARRASGEKKAFASAGYFPREGRRCPPQALEAAAEVGIDLSGHRSRVLDPAMLERADAVFVFDDDNFDTLRRRFPQARNKLHRLPLLAGDGSVSIADPYGKSIEQFRKAYREIRRAFESGYGE